MYNFLHHGAIACLGEGKVEKAKEAKEAKGAGEVKEAKVSITILSFSVNDFAFNNCPG